VALRAGLERCLVDAKTSRKPLMVFFHSPEAAGTNEIKTKCFTDPEVVRLSAQLIAVDVNTTAQPELATKYGGAVVPSVVFLSPDGEQLGAVQGFASPERVCAQMRNAIENARPSPAGGASPGGGE
jgi:hypothetical protein